VEPRLFRFDNLAQVPGVVHGISTRFGGVSQGRCESLNVSYSVGDPPENVDENLRRLSSVLGARPADLFSAYQVHGRGVTIVEPDTIDEPRPRSDVLVTRSSARTLMLRYADCTPVLLADPKQRAVAAVHAGWRGSAVRAAGAAVEALRDAFGSRPADIIAGIGPAIGPCCYVVGQDVLEAFADRPELFSDGSSSELPVPLPRGPDRELALYLRRGWTQRSGRTLDLWEANRQALIEVGVPSEQIEVAGICTQCESERFFSHRANAGQPAGRFAALIRLED
jgi:YfiH family protein